MVFRKPYGFLIKHFRLIHLIITSILIYLVSCINKIYLYINNCISNTAFKYDALEYINNNIYIWILIVLGLFFIIYLLLKYKDKLRKIYVFSIIGYVIVAIYLFLLFNFFKELPNSIIDQKVIRAYRDILIIILSFQYISIIVMFIRGLGFDIKKFNFSNDIRELELKDEDGEEIEIDFKIDTNSIVRELRKQKREFGYYFQEYKLFIIGFILIIVSILGFIIYNYFGDKYRIYKMGEVVGYEHYITINDSYYNIDDDKNYVIVRFDIFKNGDSNKLNVNNLKLIVDGVEYLPNKNICYIFNDVGTCYKKQYITANKREYILVYEVEGLNSEKTYLLYNESYDNYFKVRLKLENYE